MTSEITNTHGVEIPGRAAASRFWTGERAHREGRHAEAAVHFRAAAAEARRAAAFFFGWSHRAFAEHFRAAAGYARWAEAAEAACVNPACPCDPDRARVRAEARFAGSHVRTFATVGIGCASCIRDVAWERTANVWTHADEVETCRHKGGGRGGCCDHWRVVRRRFEGRGHRERARAWAEAVARGSIGN